MHGNCRTVELERAYALTQAPPSDNRSRLSSEYAGHWYTRRPRGSSRKLGISLAISADAYYMSTCPRAYVERVAPVTRCSGNSNLATGLYKAENARPRARAISQRMLSSGKSGGCGTRHFFRSLFFLKLIKQN